MFVSGNAEAAGRCQMPTPRLLRQFHSIYPCVCRSVARAGLASALSIFRIGQQGKEGTKQPPLQVGPLLHSITIERQQQGRHRDEDAIAAGRPRPVRSRATRAMPHAAMSSRRGA